MALPALTFSQVDFSAGQVTERAARRDDVKLQRSGLKRSENTRVLATGALAQRFGRHVYNLDSGRTELIRISDTLQFEFLFGQNTLKIYTGHGDLVNSISQLPWTLETIDDIRVTQAEREVVITFPGFRPYVASYGLSATPTAGAGTPFGDMMLDGEAPVIEGSSTYTGGPGVNHTVTLPSGIQVGEQLLMFATSVGAGLVTPTGWTQVFQVSSPTVFALFKRTATGSEAASINLATGGNDARVSATVHRISGHGGTVIADTATGTSTAPNSPNLAATWPTANALWLSAAGIAGSGSLITGTPTDYTGQVLASQASAATSVLERALEAASENPGAYTLSSSAAWVAATVAIMPALTVLGRAFDDETNETDSDSALASDDTDAYIGLDFSSDPQRISSVTTYGSNNRGFLADTDGTDEGAASDVTLTIRGKNTTAPTSASDGDSLGTVTFTDTANESGGRIILSSDSTTPYDYVWVQVAHDAAAARHILVAEVAIAVFSDAAVEQWSFGTFQFAETTQGAKRQPYVRFAAKGVGLTPSAVTGTNIDVTFDSPVLDPDHVGVSFRYHGRELVITEVTTALAGKANVIETLPSTMRVTLASAAQRDSFQIGEIAIGQTSGSEGEIVAFNSTANLDIIVFKGGNFIASENLVSERGFGVVTGAPSATDEAATSVWDEAAMSNFRGWPRNVDYDRSRLIFCDFPQALRGIAWSAVGVIRDFKVGAEGDDGFFEFVPGNGRVLHVQGGADQFVVTDEGALYIPISAASPLAPGRVEFRPIAAVGGSGVEPVSMHEGLTYVAANGRSLVAIVPTGQTAMPYRVAAISEFHASLFTSVRVLAAMTGGGDEAEQYLWVGQQDGTALVGKFDSSNEWVGFVPVTGAGNIRWISALGGTVHFNTIYPSDVEISWAMEHMDQSSYLDGAIMLNDPGDALAGEVGEGPLWFYAGQEVDLMDGDTDLGRRTVDSNGDLVELAGDDFSAATVMAGFAFTVTAIPFLPNIGEGEEKGQRVRRRRVKRAAVWVQDATRFRLMGRLFGGIAPISGTFRAPGTGRHFAPDIELEKTRPGPITITELAGEVTV